MKIPDRIHAIGPVCITSPAGFRFWGLEHLPRDPGQPPGDTRRLVASVLEGAWCGDGMTNEYRLDPAALGPSPVIVDLGANVGSFTLGAAAAIPGAQILAVEPSLQTYGCLVANILEAGAQARVVPARYAISGSNEMCVFIENLTGTCRQSWEEYRALNPAYVFSGIVGAQGRTIEALLSEYEIDAVDFMKVDIEGSEVDAFLATAPEVMRRVKRLAMELHGKPGQDEMVAHISRTHQVRVLGHLFAEVRT